MKGPTSDTKRYLNAAARSRAKSSGVGLVAAAAELASQIDELADEFHPQTAAPALARAVFLFLQALLPEAPRECRQAVAELIVLEIVRAALSQSGQPGEAKPPREKGAELKDGEFNGADARPTVLPFPSENKAEGVQEAGLARILDAVVRK
ncbi:MAG: hypothetical protein ACP5QZ_06845 [Candidatus Sumerlaeaceae bacterium]|jgi:hypothetical protein